MDLTASDQQTLTSEASPTVQVIKNLILSPTDICSNLPKATYKGKDGLRNNVFSKEFSLGSSHPGLPENKRTTPGSPTPLKAFLNDHMERLKKCREAACMVDVTKNYCITGSKNSQKSSLANSANQSTANLRQSNGHLAKSWYKDLVGTRKSGSTSQSLKRSLEKAEQSRSRKLLHPSTTNQHDEFTHQFFGKASKVYRSSVELAGESFASKLGAILQEREVYKRRSVAHNDNEDFTHAREIFESFKSRLHKNRDILVPN